MESFQEILFCLIKFKNSSNVCIQFIKGNEFKKKKLFKCFYKIIRHFVLFYYERNNVIIDARHWIDID